MSELKKGFYLVTADGINTMLRWDGEDWVDMRGIRPCFKEVVQTRYCGENNPVFEQDEPAIDTTPSQPAIDTTPQPKQEEQEPVAVVTGMYGGRFIVEPTNRAMVLPANMALYTHPQRQRVVFPTMLRQMWSGGEVQAWLDENVNKEKNT